ARANLVLTNPDMLHSGILPHHTKWATLFQNLRYVVIDELHAYRGVFGSHLANVLRRLHRICRHYGATPQFVMASATIANPGELARRLVGEPVEAIAESGAPTGDKTFVCYNPPVVNHELGIRAPYLGEAAKLAIRFLRERIATIVFAQSRLATEVLLTSVKNGVADKTGDSGLLGGRLRCDERAARSVHGHPPGLPLRYAPRARAGEPRQPVHPGESPQVRRVRAAHRSRRRRRGSREVRGC